jgi:hypothetical protein
MMMNVVAFINIIWCLFRSYEENDELRSSSSFIAIQKKKRMTTGSVVACRHYLKLALELE